MVYYKTENEIELLRKSNLLVSKTLGELVRYIEPGITTLELDKIAEDYIRSNGAVPAFLGYRGFPGTLCTSVNSTVVHGIPSNRVLKDGDIISVDCGVNLNGYFGDSAYTFPVGEVSDEIISLLVRTKESLLRGVSFAISGNRVGDISNAIQTYTESFGYGVVRELVGHGLGKHLHEEPDVPNYGRKGTGPLMKKGLVICIEPMINMGVKNVKQEKDGWTIKTYDNKPSAHYELAVAVNEKVPDVLSTFKYVEEELKKLQPDCKLITG